MEVEYDRLAFMCDSVFAKRVLSVVENWGGGKYCRIIHGSS